MTKSVVRSKEMADMAMSAGLMRKGEYPNAYPAILLHRSCGCLSYVQKLVTVLDLASKESVDVALRCEFLDYKTETVKFTDFYTAEDIIAVAEPSKSNDADDEDLYDDDYDDDDYDDGDYDDDW